MAKKRRPSPTEKDYQRIADTIYNLDTFHKIEDEETFDNAFDEYMEGSELADDKKFKSGVFNDFRKSYPSNFTKRKEFKEKRRREAELAEKIFLKEAGLVKGRKKGRRIMDVVTYKKGKLVYSEKTTVQIKGKPQARYRDSRGQFTSVKPKRK